MVADSPVGLAISGTVFTTSVMWFNVFLAWLIKSVVLKYGGVATLPANPPVFHRMILGAFVTAGTWLVIDYWHWHGGQFVAVYVLVDHHNTCRPSVNHRNETAVLGYPSVRVQAHLE